jgi:hypothetical protein
MMGSRRREIGLARLRNHLAITHLSELTAESLASICREFSFSWSNDHDSIGEIYSVVVKAVAADGRLTADEKDGLRKLRAGLGIPEAAAGAQHERAAHDVYRMRVAEAVADGTLSEDEKTTLRGVAESLDLPAASAENILNAELRKILSFALHASIADRHWSESDEAAFKALAKALDISPKFDEESTALLNRYRQLWQISQGSLPESSTTLHLSRGELCHAWEAAARHEVRSVTRRYDYSGPVVRVPIMKGVSWRFGSVTVNRVRQDQLTLLDTGIVYLTNRRVLFDGAHHTTVIPLGRVLRFTLLADGLQIEKASGRDQWFVGAGGDWELLATCLERLLLDRP